MWQLLLLLLLLLQHHDGTHRAVLQEELLQLGELKIEASPYVAVAAAAAAAAAAFAAAP
jgi:hypothetical protein